MGVYLAAPRLREVDTGLLVRAALLGGEGKGKEENGSNNNGASTSSTPWKRLFVPIVGKGPQEMSLVHLGEFGLIGLGKISGWGGISSLSLLCFAAQLLLSFSPSLFLSYPFCFPDSLDGLRTVPPFGIREPSKEYGDGRGPREDGKERFSSSSFSSRSSLSRALALTSLSLSLLFSPPSFLPSFHFQNSSLGSHRRPLPARGRLRPPGAEARARARLLRRVGAPRAEGQEGSDGRRKKGEEVRFRP